MSANTKTHYTRSSNLSDKQRSFLSKFTINPEIQRLIPSSTVGESIHIYTTTVGLLLTHQPLVERFHHEDYHRLSQLINGQKDGFVKILPSGYDYDLTHTLYYVPEGSPDRDILTSELNITGVELSGVYTFGREETSVFLEGVSDCCARSQTECRMIGGSIAAWLRVQSPRDDYFESGEVFLNGLEEEELVGSLRSECSLHLYSDRDIWVRRVGMDWPKYFFERASEVSDVSDGWLMQEIIPSKSSTERNVSIVFVWDWDMGVYACRDEHKI